MFAQETNKSWKLLLKTRQTGWSGLINWTGHFCRDRRQSGALLGFDKKSLLRPSDVWSMKELEPRQSKGLRRRLRDLIEEK
jgi:hypothetical protein